MTFDFWPWFWVIGLGAWTLRHFLEVDLCEMGICWSLSQNLVLRLNLRYSEIRPQGRTKFFRGLFLWNGYKLMFESKLGLGLELWDKCKSARKGGRNFLEVDLCEMGICWSLSQNLVSGLNMRYRQIRPLQRAVLTNQIKSEAHFIMHHPWILRCGRLPRKNDNKIKGLA